MADFNISVERTLVYEGVFSNDPDDHGGKTKYGITEATLKEAQKHLFIKIERRIEDLTIEEAKTIYKFLYWNKIKGALIDHQCVADELFDSAINCGVYNSIKFLQQALQYLNEPVIDDGVMGLQTLNYTNKWCKKDPEALFKAMNGEQYIYYKAIKQKKYKWGWLKRIQAFIRK